MGSGADLRNVVERIHATTRASGLNSPVVVGHSAGALHATAYAAFHDASGVLNVDQPVLVEPFTRFVQQRATALRGTDFVSAFAPFEVSIGVEMLPEPERGRVLKTRRVDQQLVLDYLSNILTPSRTDLQSGIDAILHSVTVPYLWLAGGPVSLSDHDHLPTHIPQARIETWSNPWPPGAPGGTRKIRRPLSPSSSPTQSSATPRALGPRRTGCTGSQAGPPKSRYPPTAARRFERAPDLGKHRWSAALTMLHLATHGPAVASVCADGWGVIGPAGTRHGR
ncbi:alpha/beta hydrolase [Pseudarthrobacter sp902506025]|uniref:alpha/beta hydrolase n=1 Tax=Pseudarthrobacter TaxID=1742993 RepID=UPI00344D0C83